MNSLILRLIAPQGLLGELPVTTFQFTTSPDEVANGERPRPGNQGREAYDCIAEAVEAEGFEIADDLISFHSAVTRAIMQHSGDSPATVDLHVRPLSVDGEAIETSLVDAPMNVDVTDQTKTVDIGMELFELDAKSEGSR